MNRNMANFNQKLSGKVKPEIYPIQKTDHYDTRSKVTNTKQYSVDPPKYAQQQSEISNNCKQWNDQFHENILKEVKRKQQSFLLGQYSKPPQNENLHDKKSTIGTTIPSKITIQEVKYQPLMQSNQQQIQLKQNEPQSQIKKLTQEQPKRSERYERPVTQEKFTRPPSQAYPQERLQELLQNSPRRKESKPQVQPQEPKQLESVQEDMYQSLARSVVLQCFHCDIGQNKDFIFLNCGHQFHAECLQSMLDHQVSQQLAVLRCKCTIKIPQNIINKYLSSIKLQIYYQIQVQLLPKYNQGRFLWKKCKDCDFIYILKSSVGMKLSRCPNCLEDIRGQSIIFDNYK